LDSTANAHYCSHPPPSQPPRAPPRFHWGRVVTARCHKPHSQTRQLRRRVEQRTRPSTFGSQHRAPPRAAAAHAAALHPPTMAKKKSAAKSKRAGSSGAGANGKSPSGKHRFSFKERAAPVDTPSAFEARSQTRKFDILGRKVKGERGNATKARSAGVTKRQNTLLKEYQSAGKANAFVDRRFGEDNPTMTLEEKSIGRLARARLRQLRPGKSFALDGPGADSGGDDDDDDNGGMLTHGGQPIRAEEEARRSAHASVKGALGGRGGRDGRGGDEDDEDDGGLDQEITRELHFGGGGDGGGFTLKRGDGEHGDEELAGPADRRKTKKEVMQELIDKSKYYKAEKAKRKEADEDLLDKLDDDFRSISGAGLFHAALSKGVGHLKPAPGAAAAAAAGRAAAKVVEVKDDYDKFTRELALEARGRASDRVRTQEEVEQAEVSHLEEAERVGPTLCTEYCTGVLPRTPCPRLSLGIIPDSMVMVALPPSA